MSRIILAALANATLVVGYVGITLHPGPDAAAARGAVGMTDAYVRVVLPALLIFGLIVGVAAVRRHRFEPILAVDGIAFAILVPAVDRSLSLGSDAASMMLGALAASAAIGFFSLLGSREAVKTDGGPANHVGYEAAPK